MKGIANLLATQYQVTILDWLGFGESQCPPVDYNPTLFQQLLGYFVKSNFNSSIIFIAAGHASGYALKFAQDNPDILSKLNFNRSHLARAFTSYGFTRWCQKWGEELGAIAFYRTRVILSQYYPKYC